MGETSNLPLTLTVHSQEETARSHPTAGEPKLKDAHTLTRASQASVRRRTNLQGRPRNMQYLDDQVNCFLFDLFTFQKFLTEVLIFN